MDKYNDLKAAASHGIGVGDKFILPTTDGRFVGGFKTLEACKAFKGTTEAPHMAGFRLKQTVIEIASGVETKL